MPIEFKQTAMPQGSTDNELYKLEMKYDGSGRRISKTVWRKAVGAENWQKKQVMHYTGIGTEIRENYHNESLEKAKVVVNMPEGLGRYGIEDAKGPDIGFGAGYIPNVKFEWYLKNHLGSTMLVYGTEGNATSDPFTLGTPLAAYDYRAFGEQLTLLPAGDKFTENFTGSRFARRTQRTACKSIAEPKNLGAKRNERDDEIALNYFGARYLDPMLGMWISMDPKRQFASPYLYAGNGMNPVNVIDPDGNYIIMEHDVNNPEYHHYTFSYNSFGDHVIEWFANFIPGSGIVGIIPPKGVVEHSLHPSAAEGTFSTVFDVASNAVKFADNVFSGVKLAFKYIGRAKMAYTGLQTLKQHPKLEDYMRNLTKGSSLLSSPNLDDLKKKADWATSYGENLFNQGVEITDEVRAQFHTDFQAEFPNGAKDDN